MTTQEIANFIKTQLKLGSSRVEIEKILSLNHVPPQDTSAAFEMAMSETGGTPTPPPIPAAPPGMTGINNFPKASPTAATVDQAFPPPATVLDSIDSVTPAPSLRSGPSAPPPPPPVAAPVFPPPPIPAPSLRSGPSASTSPGPSAPPPVTPSSFFRSTPPAPVPTPSFRSGPSAPPIPPQPRQKSSAGMWILLIFILIILGLGGTGAYAYIAKPAWAKPLLDLLQPTLIEVPVATTTEPVVVEPPVPVDPTTDWQTYTNDKFGFAFKYPGSIISNNDFGNQHILEVLLKADLSTSAISANRLKIVSFMNSPSPCTMSSSTQPIDVKTVGDISFKRFNDNQNTSSTTTQDILYQTTNNKDCYSIVLDTISGQPDVKELNLIDQILSTFKFIATSTATTTTTATTSPSTLHASSSKPLPPETNLPSLFQ